MNLKKIYNCVMSVCVPCLYEYKRDVVLSGARKGNLEFFMGRERRGGGKPINNCQIKFALLVP